MIHLAHPKDEIAVQVLAFLRVLLYLGNENSQKKIGRLFYFVSNCYLVIFR